MVNDSPEDGGGEEVEGAWWGDGGGVLFALLHEP